MTPSEWIKDNKGKFGSPYEELFVRNVLSRIPDFSFETLQAQMPFKDFNGTQRYCDFAFTEGPGIKIALEVDGWDKRGTGSGQTYNELDDWLERQNALVYEGWVPLRFSNRRVRDKPSKVVEHIVLTLRRERKNPKYQDKLTQSLGELNKKSQDARKLSAELQGLRDELASVQRAKNIERAERTRREAELKILVQRAELASQEKTRLEEELVAAQNALDLLSRTKSLAPAEQRKLDDYDAKMEKLEGEVDIMKTTIWALALIIGLVIVALIFRDRGPVPPGPTPTPIVETPPPTPGSSCEVPISWQEAKGLVGQTVALSGPVVGVTSNLKEKGRPTWINIGAPFPATSRLTLVIWGNNIERFGIGLATRLQGKTVCALGKVTLYRDSPQIELKHPGQL
jgi:very-short-patch-repair endonuclease